MLLDSYWYTVRLNRDSSYGCTYDDDEKQKLISTETMHNRKNGDNNDDEKDASDHSKDSVLNECSRLCCEQQRNGQMTNLGNSKHDKLLSLNSTLIVLDNGHSNIDDESASEKNSDTIAPSSNKGYNKENTLREHFKSPVRKMSVLFSKENSVLIEIAPKNPDKVDKTN